MNYYNYPSYYPFYAYNPMCIDARTNCYDPNFYNGGYHPNSFDSSYPSYEIKDEGFRQVGCEEAARINASMDYVNRNMGNQGLAGGVPNFHQAKRGDGELVYGTIMFKREAVDNKDALKSEFGNIDRRDVGAMMRAASSYAGAKGYAAGIPTFHLGPNVYGIVLFKPGTAETVDVTADELGNPRDIGERFRAVSSYAGQRGYAAAFPNFHQRRREDGVLVYGVVLIKPGNAEVRDVLAKDLNLPAYYSAFGCQSPPPDKIEKEFQIVAAFHHKLVLVVKYPRNVQHQIERNLERCVQQAISAAAASIVVTWYLSPAATISVISPIIQYTLISCLGSELGNLIDMRVVHRRY
ncbi:hypothetical protein ACYX6U_08965 [Bacillus cereus]